MTWLWRSAWESPAQVGRAVCKAGFLVFSRVGGPGFRQGCHSNIARVPVVIVVHTGEREMLITNVILYVKSAGHCKRRKSEAFRTPCVCFSVLVRQVFSGWAPGGFPARWLSTHVSGLFPFHSHRPQLRWVSVGRRLRRCFLPNSYSHCHMGQLLIPSPAHLFSMTVALDCDQRIG